MGVLQRFERRVETLVNGAFARAFKSEVQPVEIAGALQREADDKAQVLSRERVMVPNAYVVELSARDHERLEPWAEPLQAELAAMVSEHAQTQGYSPMGPVRVEFERHDDLETGMFRVRSRGDLAPPAVRVEARRAALPPPPLMRPEPRYQPQLQYPAQPAYQPEPQRRPTPARTPVQTTQPAAAVPSAWLEIDGVRHPLPPGVSVIGRGSEADLRLDDPGVSRRHAQVQIAGEHARLLDLGSTNGTLLHGQRVRDVTLQDGDAIVFGRSTVVFRRMQPRPVADEGDSFVPGLR